MGLDRRLVLASGALVVATALAGCAMPTGYTAAGTGSPYGYAEERIDATTWRVRFAGNSATSRDRVDSLLLYRAAELAQSRGAARFVVLEKTVERETSYHGSVYPSFGYYRYGGFGFGSLRRYGYRYPHFGFGFGAPYPGTASLRPVHRYTGHASIRLFETEAPEGLGVPYVTAEVLRSLGPVIAPEGASASPSGSEGPPIAP